MWLVLLLVLLIPLVRAGFLLRDDDVAAAAAMLVVFGLASLALWLVLPRAYELSPDRLRVVLGGPLGWEIDLKKIENVRVAPGRGPLLRPGALFATSLEPPVVVRRRKGMSIILSPEQPADFIAAVEQALAGSRQGV